MPSASRVDLDVKVHILGIGGDFTRMIRVVDLLVQDHRPHRVSGAGSYPWRPWVTPVSYAALR
jgi:hypothetical protein